MPHEPPSHSCIATNGAHPPIPWTDGWAFARCTISTHMAFRWSSGEVQTVSVIRDSSRSVPDLRFCAHLSVCGTRPNRLVCGYVPRSVNYGTCSHGCGGGIRTDRLRDLPGGLGECGVGSTCPATSGRGRTVTPAEKNWAGNITFGARRLCVPRSVRELRDAVAASDAVRPLGTRHSFNTVADTTGDHVSLAGLPRVVDIDASGKAVALTAGLRFGSSPPNCTSTGSPWPTWGRCRTSRSPAPSRPAHTAPGWATAHWRAPCAHSPW